MFNPFADYQVYMYAKHTVLFTCLPSHGIYRAVFGGSAMTVDPYCCVCGLKPIRHSRKQVLFQSQYIQEQILLGMSTIMYSDQR